MEAPEDPTATEFYRKFSFELESQNCDDEPPNELTLAVIDERKRDEDRQKQLREWRKYFEPCPISEFGNPQVPSLHHVKANADPI